MRVSVAADERIGVGEAVDRGASPPRPSSRSRHGALADGERDDWAWASEAAARDVAEGRAEQAIVCCWTGTGASIAANKVPGVRAALCARRRRPPPEPGGGTTPTCSRSACAPPPRPSWARSSTPGSRSVPSGEADDRANVDHLAEIERGDGLASAPCAACFPTRARPPCPSSSTGSTLVDSPARGPPVRGHQLRGHPRRQGHPGRALGRRSAATPTPRCWSACGPRSTR